MDEYTRKLLVSFLRNMGVTDPSLHLYSDDMLTMIGEVVMLENALITE